MRATEIERQKEVGRERERKEKEVGRETVRERGKRRTRVRELGVERRG